MNIKLFSNIIKLFSKTNCKYKKNHSCKVLFESCLVLEIIFLKTVKEIVMN